MDAPSSTFFALASSVPHEKAASPAPKLRQSPYSMPINKPFAGAAKFHARVVHKVPATSRYIRLFSAPECRGVFHAWRAWVEQRWEHNAAYCA
jgi:hypothetical protein